MAGMFAKYYLELPYPIGVLKAALLSEPPASWLPALVSAGGDLEELLMAEVGFTVAGRRLGSRVEIKVGEPAALGEGMAMPLSWKSASREELFPKLEADLELAPLGNSMTQLSVNARYEPPLALVGRILDRTLLHRVAEAVIRDFTERIGQRLRLLVAAAAA